MRLPFTALLACVIAGPSLAGPTGTWMTDSDKSHVRTAPCEDAPDRPCGTTVRLKKPLADDGEPQRGVGNEDEARRGRPVVGLRMVWSMKDYNGGERGDGRIYNPATAPPAAPK